MDNTIIVFTSDNGPALQGSTGDLRGGKYLAYEGGQKVPFMIRWGNNGGLFKAGSTYDESATLVDLFPTLVEMCGITGNGGTEKNYLPADRVIDGVSMVPVFTQNKVIHTAETPILHMKREKLKAIQYAVPTAISSRARSIKTMISMSSRIMSMSCSSISRIYRTTIPRSSTNSARTGCIS